MRRLKVVGLAFLAVLVVGVVTAASASAASTILPELTLETPGSGTSATGSLLLEGTEIKCNKATNSFGTTSKKLGTFKIVFTECKNGGKGCISLGQTLGSGTIETTGEWHLVSLLEHRTHYYLWLLLSASDNTAALHLECEVAGLVLVWGNLLALIEPISERTWKLNVEREGSGSTIKQKASQSEFGNNSGETVKAMGLKGKLGTGTERPGGEESTENLISFTSPTSIKEN